MAQKDKLTSMGNAKASVHMEGCHITPDMRKQCAQILARKTTTAECLKQYVTQDSTKVIK